MRNSIRVSAIFLVSAAGGLCQTRVNLQAQSQNADFSAFESTRPFKSGTAVPMECAVGETFFKTDAPAGQNFYGCTTANTWTLQGGWVGGPSQDLTDLKVTATSGTVLAVAGGAFGVDSSTFSLSPVTITIRSFGVQAVGAANPATVTLTEDVVGVVRNGDTVSISGVNGSGCGMFNGTFSVIVTGARQLTLANVNGSGCSYSGGGTVAGTGSGTAYVFGSGNGLVTVEVPASSGVIASCAGACVVNQVVVPAMAVNGVPLAEVTISAGAWNSATDKRSFISTRQISAGTGIAISSLGGGASVSIDTALVPQLGGSNTWTGSNDLSGASRTASFKSGTIAPGTCAVGDTFFDTDAPEGSNFLGCTATNTWTAQGGGSGDGLGSATYANIVALWTTCSGYLKSDGTCSTTATATAMTLATENNTDNAVPVSVGTSGRAFEKTPVTIDPSTGDIVTPGSLSSGSGTDPWNMTGYTDDAAPSAPGGANQFTSFFDRASGLPAWILSGGAQKYVALGDSTGKATVANVTAPLKTRVATAVISGTGTGGLLQDTDDVLTYIWKNDLGFAVTVTLVSCETDSTTASRIQLMRRDGSPAAMLMNNSGAGLDCSSTAAAGTLDPNEDNFSDGQSIGLTMVSAGGAGKELAVTIRYTID